MDMTHTSSFITTRALKMASTEISPTSSCNGNDDFFSFMPINTMTIIFITSLCLTVLLCCVSSILCCAICIMCRRRHRTSDLQDLPKAGGYVKPVLKEDKEQIETQEPSAETFKALTNTANRITNEEVHIDTIVHNETVITPTTNSHDDFFGTDKEAEIDNPLYLKNIKSPNDRGSVDRNYFTLNTPGTQHQKMPEMIDDNDYENEHDYENSSSLKLVEQMTEQFARQSPTAVSQTKLTTVKHPTTNKHNPPKTKPKPEQKKRTDSIQSDTSQHELVPNNNQTEPHYMSPRNINTFAWKAYKELDFSTVEPTGEYTILTREFLTS